MSRSSHTGLIPTLAGVGTLFLLAGVLHTNSATAAEVNWSAYNRETVSNDIIPSYAAFAEQTRALQSATAALCQSPDAPHLAQARTAYKRTMTAWQEVSQIQFGPVQFLMRNYSIQYWPDRKSIGRRQLQTVLDMPADTALDSSFFHEASVSIKGLPALERLLFTENALDRLKGEGIDCRLTAAIATNLNEMAEGIYSDWRDSSETILNEGSTVDDDEEAGAVPELSVNLMKSLVEPVELIRDTKLLAVLGRGPDATYPHRAESWMSEYSLANIRANVDAAYALYKGESAGLDQLLASQGQAQIAEQIEADFAQLNQQLAPLGDSLIDALAHHYDEVKALTVSLRQLDESLNRAMQVLGVQLGFNSRDGD